MLNGSYLICDFIYSSISAHVVAVVFVFVLFVSGSAGPGGFVASFVTKKPMRAFSN